MMELHCYGKYNRHIYWYRAWLRFLVLLSLAYIVRAAIIDDSVLGALWYFNLGYAICSICYYHEEFKVNEIFRIAQNLFNGGYNADNNKGDIPL